MGVSWLGLLCEPAYKQALISIQISRKPMQRTEPNDAGAARYLKGQRMVFPMIMVALQVIAAAFFVFDSIEDQITKAPQGFNLDAAMECVIALALLGGIILSSRYILRLKRELLWKDQRLASARGALGEHILLQFQSWGLTPGEGEVALFALKGCDIAEIARLRGAAAGTVRSQLSQVYAKAGVTSQAMLVSLFIDDLLAV
jgi:DNA-binding CsgD family transcriptional regulator